MRSKFIAALAAHQPTFGIDLADGVAERLADFFELVQRNNPLLHLVAPCTAEEFATRHVLESLMLLRHLGASSEFADVGPGAGLPSIPCLLAREDLRAVLIESKIRKADYLEKAKVILGLSGRGTVVNKQFEEVRDLKCSIVTCRALDKFNQRLPRLLKWAKGRRLLLFGGPALAESLKDQGKKFESVLMPLSEQRFLFVLER